MSSSAIDPTTPDPPVARVALSLCNCATCGKLVEPLRAPAARMVDAGKLLLFCSEDCAEQRSEPLAVVQPPPSEPRDVRLAAGDGDIDRARVDAESPAPLDDLVSRVAARPLIWVGLLLVGVAVAGFVTVTSALVTVRIGAAVSTASLLLCAIACRDAARWSRSDAVDFLPPLLASAVASACLIVQTWAAWSGSVHVLAETNIPSRRVLAVLTVSVAVAALAAVAQKEIVRMASEVTGRLPSVFGSASSSERDWAQLGDLPRSARISSLLSGWSAVWVPFLAVVAVALLKEPDPVAALLLGSSIVAAFPWRAFRISSLRPYAVALEHASRAGISLGDAAATERLGRIRSLFVPASRVVTQPTLLVAEVVAIDDKANVAYAGMAARAATTVQKSRLASAISQIDQRGENVTGASRSFGDRGFITQLHDGTTLLVGDRRLVMEHGVSVAAAEPDAQRSEAKGRLVRFVAHGSRVRAMIAFEEAPRLNARSALQRIADLDIDIVLVSAEPRGMLATLAAALGVDHVRADATTEDIVSEMRRARAAGELVGVVAIADDRELLSAADIGLALGAPTLGNESARPSGVWVPKRAGTVISIERDDPLHAWFAIWLARNARDRGRWDTGTCVVLAGLGVGLAALGFIGVGGASLFALVATGLTVPAAYRFERDAWRSSELLRAVASES